MNNYQKQYESLIHFRKVEQPIDDSIVKNVHRHHIKPKSLYKSLQYDAENIVRLYVLEHCEAHRLLMLWYKDEYGILSDEFIKMTFAYQQLARKYDKSSSIYKEMRHMIDEATSIRNQNSVWINDGKHEFFVLKSKIQTIEYSHCTLGRISQPNKNRIIVTDGIHNKFVIESTIPNGFHKGFTTPSTRDKIWINDGIHQRMISNNDPIPNGWNKGMCTKNPCNNSIWINDGKHMKRIHGEIPNGWKRGKLPHKLKGQLIYVNDGIHTIKVKPDAIPPGYVKGCLCCSKNRKWITNGKIKRLLKPNEPLPDGFVFGLKFKLT